jgi:hypothetical protein
MPLFSLRPGLGVSSRHTTPTQYQSGAVYDPPL